MASPGLTELVTTTLRNRTGKLEDSVTRSQALLSRMKQRGNIVPANGGRTIVQELEYAQNATFKRYAGYEVLDISPSDVFTAAEFDWKQAAVAVTISGLEQVQNSGPEQIINLLASRIKNAEKTMANYVWSDMYSNGTADSGKQIGGLQLLVADDPTTGTVGGINRATWGFWRNQKFQTTTDGGSLPSTANILRYMNAMWGKLVRGQDRPDLIMAHNDFYQVFWNSLQAIQRITSPEMGRAGFISLQFLDADVVLDGFDAGASGIAGDTSATAENGVPAKHMYFLNTNYLHWRPHPERNMVPLETVNSLNQDASVRLLVFAGNMTISNAFLNGVMFYT